PIVRRFHVRGAGQPRADAVHQLRGRVHDFRVAEALLPDPSDHVEVDRLRGRQRRDDQTETEDQGRETRSQNWPPYWRAHATTSPGQRGNPGARGQSDTKVSRLTVRAGKRFQSGRAVDSQEVAPTLRMRLAAARSLAGGRGDTRRARVGAGESFLRAA